MPSLRQATSSTQAWSTLLNRGASLSEVQDVLGHASPEVTKLIYAH